MIGPRGDASYRPSATSEQLGGDVLPLHWPGLPRKAQTRQGGEKWRPEHEKGLSQVSRPGSKRARSQEPGGPGTARSLLIPEPCFLPASLSPTYRVSCSLAGPLLMREGDGVTATREPLE